MKLKWEVRKRLEEIERCLFWAGRLSRSDLTDKFGISVQQASADISQYQSIAPNSISLNRSLRQYEPVENFVPSIISPSIKDYVEWKNRGVGYVENVSMPLREIELPSLRMVVNALHQQNSVEISYQSMSSTDVSVRRITPHTIVFDGYRFHARSYCHLRNEFRDFLLGRICAISNIDKPGKLKEQDEAWNTYLPLRLGPHPGLTPSQKDIIMKDFGMQEGELLLKVRQAMLHYTLTQLRLDRFTEKRSPAEQQVILLNPDILKLK